MASQLKLDDQDWIVRWKPTRSELMRLNGLIVSRGKTWTWGNQDRMYTKGKTSALGMVEVMWKCGHRNSYRVGKGYSDLRFLNPTEVQLEEVCDEIQFTIDREVERLQAVQNKQF